VNRILSIVPALGAALLLAGCPPITDAVFDLSQVVDASYGQPYEAFVTVVDYDGPARFTHGSGLLPEGMSLNEAGRLAGTPMELGDFEITVLASDMKRVEDFVEPVTLRVLPPEDAFLGYEHDQINNMTAQGGFMRGIWVRVNGAGEEGQESWTMNPGVYLPGVNNIAEDGQDDALEEGRFDDVRLSTLDFSELEIFYSGWEATIEESYDPPQYPNPHTPEGDPPTINSSGTVTAGADTGGAELRLVHPEYGEVTTTVFVVPPDWCPYGEHPLGGQTKGFCM
jgi:hypothetical protein